MKQIMKKLFWKNKECLLKWLHWEKDIVLAKVLTLETKVENINVVSMWDAAWHSFKN